MAGFRLRLITGTAIALTGAACAGTALADTKLGWYVAADGGHDLSSSQALKVTDVTLTSSTPGATAPAQAGSYTLKPDYAAEGFARVGYRLTPNLRGEIELGARPGTVINGLGGSRTADLGSFDKTSLMANVIYDLRPDWGVHPFVGVGAGVVRVNTDYNETGSTTGHALTYGMTGDKTVPAGQLLAGASWDVTKSLHFDMTYRYLRTASTSYDVAMSDTHGANTDTWTAKANGPIKDQSLSVGMRWTFGADSAPPPRPAYAEAPARPAAKPIWSGLHLPSVTLPFTHSRKAAVQPAPVQQAATSSDTATTDTQAMAAPAMPMAQATVPPASAPQGLQPAVPVPVAQASEADTAPGSDAAATAKTPKRLFAASARAPGKKTKTRAVKTPPATELAAADPAPAAPSQAISAPASAPANDPAPATVPDTVAPAPVPAQPASAVTTSELPAAAPAEAPRARRFIAYFPLGGAHLDDKAQAVVADAAQHAQSGADSHVRVDGYADTSGSAAYNMGLSRRRATAVADALKAGGVAPETITVAWHGETHLAVKTGNGVKSAKNRRVTIGVHFGAAKAHKKHHRRHRHRHG